ncbi:hypothetical protein IID62_00060 [candidate division KSB1 bacterium]|nr:hypothetical protein [candidate division KSB1 bacterium]
MRKLIGSLIKYFIIFLVILALVAVAGNQLREYTYSVEQMLGPTVENLLIMVSLKQDTTGIGAAIDTTLTPNELLELQIRLTQKMQDLRSVQLDSSLQSIQGIRDSISVARQDILSRQTVIEQAEQDNFVKLAKVFDAMAPEIASAILLQLPDDSAVEILYQMSEREAGKLIESLDPVRAADIIERFRRRSGG